MLVPPGAGFLTSPRTAVEGQGNRAGHQIRAVGIVVDVDRRAAGGARDRSGVQGFVTFNVRLAGALGQVDGRAAGSQRDGRNVLVATSLPTTLSKPPFNVSAAVGNAGIIVAGRGESYCRA